VADAGPASGAAPGGSPRPAIGILLHDFAVGGSERVAIRLANAWSRLGCRVVVLAGAGQGSQRQLVEPGVGVEIAQPPMPRTQEEPGALGEWFGWRCVALGLDVGFLPGNSYFRAVATAAAAVPRLPLYAKISNVLWRDDRSLAGNLLFAVKTRHRLRGARALVAMSPSLARQARRLLGSAHRVEMLPNPVLGAMPVAAVARRPWHLCAAGRLVPQKDFALLLKSFALLADLPVTLDIVGDGPQEEQLRQLAAALGVAGKVTFSGRVDDVHTHMAAAEILLLTSGFEGYPAVVVEAFAAGTFVIARNCSPAIPEIISSPAIGTCVDSRDPAAFAAAVRRYFDRRECDRHQMRQVAEKHLASTVARRYLQLFAGHQQVESDL
jgi:glycosyltransferase involved in cell wall biosynthesis